MKWCESCTYFDTSKKCCYRFPPVAIVVYGDNIVRWEYPIVREQYFCGEYKQACFCDGLRD